MSDRTILEGIARGWGVHDGWCDGRAGLPWQPHPLVPRGLARAAVIEDLRRRRERRARWTRVLLIALRHGPAIRSAYVQGHLAGWRRGHEPVAVVPHALRGLVARR